jgi:putative cell wall-binding protein
MQDLCCSVKYLLSACHWIFRVTKADTKNTNDIPKKNARVRRFRFKSRIRIRKEIPLTKNKIPRTKRNIGKKAYKSAAYIVSISSSFVLREQR